MHTIIPNKTQWLFSNLAFFRAKNHLPLSANGESSLDVMSLFLFACGRSTVIQAISLLNPLLNTVKVPNTIPQAHELYEPNWSLHRYGKVAEMFRNGLYAENSRNLDRYSL